MSNLLYNPQYVTNYYIIGVIKNHGMNVRYLRYGDDKRKHYDNTYANKSQQDALMRDSVYEGLLPISKDLIMLLYGDKSSFVNASGNDKYENIESVIFYYDKYLGDVSMPTILSIKAGIFIPTLSPLMYDYLYSKLYTYIETASEQTPYSEEKVEVLTLDEAIGYTKPQWEKYIKENFPTQPPSHETRSDFVMDMFYRIDRD